MLFITKIIPFADQILCKAFNYKYDLSNNIYYFILSIRYFNGRCERQEISNKNKGTNSK